MTIMQVALLHIPWYAIWYDEGAYSWIYLHTVDQIPESECVSVN